MMKMLFLPTEFCNPEVQRKFNIPLKFISFAYIEAKMYQLTKNHAYIISPSHSGKVHGNRYVYGGLFVCEYFNYYVEILDSYHGCSKSKLNKNHIMDLQHRVDYVATPIRFKTVEQLERLMYDKGGEVEVQVYFGNPQHPKIRRNLYRKGRHARIVDGIDLENFKQLLREEI